MRISDWRSDGCSSDLEARRLIRAFLATGHCEFNAQFGSVLPITVFLDMMGLPYSDAALLKPLADQVTRPDGTMTMPQVMQAFSDYLAPRLAACRIDPQPGLLSHKIGRAAWRERVCPYV